MRGLGDQIAVLDGLGALDPNDGRIGQTRARVDQYGRRIAPNVLARRVVSAAGGANYSGGSTYAPGLPLMPSTVGLAGFRDIPSVLPPRRGVVAPSNGYSGGASWTGGMPLLPSNAGLAGRLIDGGYGRAGLGGPLIDGGYGRAGLGQTATYADADLAAAAETAARNRGLDPGDGRIGQRTARVDEYGRPVMRGVLERSNVIDPSEGANYGGGSSYASGLPLLPSNAGLAGASCGCVGGLGATPLVKVVKLSVAQARRLYAQHTKTALTYLLTAKATTSAEVRQLSLQRYKQHMLAACRLRFAAQLPKTAACSKLLVAAAGRAAPKTVYDYMDANQTAWR